MLLKQLLLPAMLLNAVNIIIIFVLSQSPCSGTNVALGLAVVPAVCMTIFASSQIYFHFPCSNQDLTDAAAALSATTVNVCVTGAGVAA